MSDEELRRRIRDLAHADLPPGFVHALVDRLPDRRPGLIGRWAGFVAAAAVGLVAVVGFVLIDDGAPSATATASPSASTDSSASEVAPLDLDPDVVLSIEMTPSGIGREGRPNEVVFRLTDDGRVMYVDYDFGGGQSEPLVAYLTDKQVDDLVEWGIGPGGIGDAQIKYPRAGRGGAGSTTITVNSRSLQKQIVYGLPAGNLARDDDPTLGTLPDLVRRLSRFSDEVAAGGAVGGHPATDDERARELAIGDPRIGWPASAPGAVRRVYPQHPMSSAYFVEVAIDSIGNWNLGGLTDTCDVDREGPITGLIWLVDVVTDEVLGISPMWGDVSCLSGAEPWEEPALYVYTLESLCGEQSLIGRFRIEVLEGQATRIERIDGGPQVHRDFVQDVPTLSGIFELATEARRAGADVVRLRTDPDRAYPLSLEIDWNRNATDDELCYAISDVEVIEVVPLDQP